MVIYNSFIASNFSYCPLAWHFCSIASTNKLEKVQERALRFINNDYSSSLKKLLSQTKTEPLHVKRLKLMACEVFKIVNKLSPEYIQDMISIKTSTYNFRGERKAEITGPRSAVGNVSGYRCVSDCKSRGREFDPGPVPYFRGD